MAKAETLTDNFDSPTRLTTLWTQFGAALGTLPSQSNGQLVFTTSTTAGYGGYDSVATYDLAGSYIYVQMTSSGNQALASLEVQPLGWIVDASNGFGWYLNGGTLAAWKKVAAARSNVSTVAYSSTNHQWLRIRESAGTIFWDTSTNGITWTNFTTLANPFGSIATVQQEISVGTFAAEASATTATFDNLNIQQNRPTIGNRQPGISWTRRFAKSKQRTYFVAKPTITNTNYTQSLSGGLSFTGLTPMRTGKVASGALSFTGTFSKRAGKTLTGVLSFTGSFNRFISHLMTAGLSFTGTLAKRTSRAFTAGLSFTGTLLAAAIRFLSLTASLSFTGSFSKRTTKPQTGVLSFTGSIAKQSNKVLSAGLSFTGSLQKSISKVLSAALSFTGTLLKRTAHALSGVLSFTGSLLSGTLRYVVLTAALSFTGNLSKRTTKALSASLGFTGSIIKLIQHNMTAALSFTGSIIKRVARSLAAGLSFTGTLTTNSLFFRVFTASLSFTGSISKRTAKTLSGSLSYTGSIAKRISKSMTAALSFTGSFSAIKIILTVVSRNVVWLTDGTPALRVRSKSDKYILLVDGRRALKVGRKLYMVLER